MIFILIKASLKRTLMKCLVSRQMPAVSQSVGHRFSSPAAKKATPKGGYQTETTSYIQRRTANNLLQIHISLMYQLDQ